jgi:hypothetical protein
MLVAEQNTLWLLSFWLSFRAQQGTCFLPFSLTPRQTDKAHPRQYKKGSIPMATNQRRKSQILSLILGVSACLCPYLLSQSTSSTPGPDEPLGTVESPMHIGGDVSAPKAIRQVDPGFVPTKKEMKHNTGCEATLVVNEQGIPEKIRIIRCMSLRLEQSFTDALGQYRFKPAMYHGRPVAVSLSISYEASYF